MIRQAHDLAVAEHFLNRVLDGSPVSSFAIRKTASSGMPQASA